MWYLLLHKTAFCICHFLRKASLPICRGSTDQAASDRWILKTAVFKFGLRFLGAAHWYRLPPASTGLRFHSRCHHLLCSTYWSLSYEEGKSLISANSKCKPCFLQTSFHPNHNLLMSSKELQGERNKAQGSGKDPFWTQSVLLQLLQETN